MSEYMGRRFSFSRPATWAEIAEGYQQERDAARAVAAELLGMTSSLASMDYQRAYLHPLLLRADWLREKYINKDLINEPVSEPD